MQRRVTVNHHYHESVVDDAAMRTLMASERIEDNLIAAFYADGNSDPHMEILDRIAHIDSDERQADLLSMFALITSWRRSPLAPEVIERLKAMVARTQGFIENNPAFEPLSKR